MANKKKLKINYKIYLILGITLLLILFIILKNSNNPKPIHQLDQNQKNINLNLSSQTISKKYHSKLLDITIEIPKDVIFKEENALNEIILEKNGGLIKIHEFGTNRSYKNVSDLLDDSYNTTDIKSEMKRQKINIKGINCEIVVEKYQNQPDQNNRSYYCFRNNNSFLSISTNSPELYSDLDQIAQSFRYEP